MFAETGTSINPMVPGLENVVGVGVHPIHAVKALDELQNLYVVSRYPGKSL